MKARETVSAMLVLLTLLAGSAAGRGLDAPARAREAVKRTRCLNNLRQIGALLTMLEMEGKLEYLEGPAFLLQVAPKLTDDDLLVFLCPCDPRFADFAVDPAKAAKAYREDWRTAPCSYLGPDAQLLVKLRKGEAGNLIVACDSDPKRHADGVCALFADGRTEFIRWSDIPVFQGEPIPEIRPGIPDPRRAPSPPPEESSEPPPPALDRKELLPRIWAEVQRLRDMRAELEARMRKLEEEFERAAKRLREIAAGEAPPPRPKIEARITGISGKVNLVILSAGSAEGVKEGMRFEIRREGEVVGYVLIQAVSEHTSSGPIVTTGKPAEVRPGTIAVYR